MAYMTADRAGLTTQRQQYRDRLLSSYNTSSFARILSDPQYMEKVQNEKEKNEKLADDILAQMRSANRTEAYRLATNAAQEATADEYKVRFALLAALNAGQDAGDTVQVAALKSFAQTYRDYPESKYADEVLKAIAKRDLVGDEVAPLIIGNQEVVSVQTDKEFVYSEGKHDVLLVFNPKENMQSQSRSRGTQSE